jgi:nucleoside 2-deoxyribosyltransferase
VNIPLDIKRIYLASPYSHPDPKVREERFDQVSLAAAYMMDQGYVVFSPIVHSHVIAKYMGNTLDHEFWLTQDGSHIITCAEVWVYKLDGWLESFGVSWEIGFSNGRSIPVHYLHPDVVHAWAQENHIPMPDIG